MYYFSALPHVGHFPAVGVGVKDGHNHEAKV